MRSPVNLSDDEIRMIVTALRVKAQIEHTKATDMINRLEATLIDDGLVSDVLPGRAHETLDAHGKTARRMDELADRLIAILRS